MMKSAAAKQSPEKAKQWLIRKGLSTARRVADRQEFAILGPYFRDQIKQMLEEGALDADDEVCPENGYWFALFETEEVRRILGLDVIFETDNPDATRPDLSSKYEENLTPEPMKFDAETTGILTRQGTVADNTASGKVTLPEQAPTEAAPTEAPAEAPAETTSDAIPEIELPTATPSAVAALDVAESAPQPSKSKEPPSLNEALAAVPDVRPISIEVKRPASGPAASRDSAPEAPPEAARPRPQAPVQPAMRTIPGQLTRIRTTATGLGPREIAGRFPRVSVARSLGYYDKTQTGHVMGVERNRIWGILFFLFLTLALLGVLWVLRSLKV